MTGAPSVSLPNRFGASTPELKISPSPLGPPPVPRASPNVQSPKLSRPLRAGLFAIFRLFPFHERLPKLVPLVVLLFPKAYLIPLSE